VNYEEQALRFSCGDDTLYGILTMPQQPQPLAVLIVVGGPQYRAGSHRQFVLLARELASHGYPVLRFDYRGMGDSEGEPRNFELVDDDLRAAVNALFDIAPSTREVVVWGLCDGASAALFYAHQDPRVSGLVLVNPWVRTVESEAKARLRHYYQSRLFDTDLWRKIARGNFSYAAAARSLWTSVERACRSAPRDVVDDDTLSLPDRLHDSFSRFKGQVLLILSEHDLTAQEFSDLAQSREWQTLIHSPRVQCFRLLGANHTFSSRELREKVAATTRKWLAQIRQQDCLRIRTH